MVKREKDHNHRNFITHAPLLHLGIGLAGLFAGAAMGRADIQLFSILYVVGTWTHFFFDSFGYGIMWLWPFNSNIYAFHNRKVVLSSQVSNFFEYYRNFLRRYFKDPVFYLELAVIAIALLIKFKML